jgi:hypothetical protein
MDDTHLWVDELVWAREFYEPAPTAPSGIAIVRRWNGDDSFEEIPVSDLPQRGGFITRSEPVTFTLDTSWSDTLIVDQHTEIAYRREIHAELDSIQSNFDIELARGVSEPFFIGDETDGQRR